MLKGELSSVKPGGAAAQEAQASFRKALEIDPAFVNAHVALIRGSLQQGALAPAKQQVELLRASAPGHPLTVLTEGQVAYADNRLELASELSLQLLRVFPDLPDALHLAGLIELRTGSVAQSIRHFRKALNIDPTLDTTRTALAAAEQKAGQAEDSLKTLQPLLQTGRVYPSPDIS